MAQGSSELFDSAGWYDAGINWAARLPREIPVLGDVFGPPGNGGVLDAGCGTGRHAAAMARAGYRVVGLDASAEMLAVARQHGQAEGVEITWVQAGFAEAAEAARAAGGCFDGVYCVGNSLAAAGSREGVRQALAELAGVLRPGGRMLLQVLNFDKLRRERPCVRGPRVAAHAGREYVSVRAYAFGGETVEITNVMLWQDGGWKQHAQVGVVCAVSPDEVLGGLAAGGMKVEAAWSSYQRDAFDKDASDDLIVVAVRR